MHPCEGKKCLGLEVAPAPPQTAIAHTRQSQAGQTAVLGCRKHNDAAGGTLFRSCTQKQRGPLWSLH